MHTWVARGPTGNAEQSQLPKVAGAGRNHCCEGDESVYAVFGKVVSVLSYEKWALRPAVRDLKVWKARGRLYSFELKEKGGE